jgi:hypothetical protein
MNNELERKRPWRNLGTVSAFAQRDLGKPPKPTVRIVGVMTEIRTEYLPNISLER